MRDRFFRRMALLLAALFLLSLAILALLAWWAATSRMFPWHMAPWPGQHWPGPWHARPWHTASIVLALAVAAFVIGTRLRGATSPVGDVMEAAGRLAEGRYNVRVIERGPPETRRLVRSFNEMASRLRTHEEQRRHLLAEVTHELKTPLAVIQANVEGLIDGVYPRDDAHLLPVLEEIKLLSVLVDDLRTLALAETGQLRLHREAIDPGGLVRDTVAAFRSRADAASVDVQAEIESDLPGLQGDPVRVRQVLTILLTNALQQTPAGGVVRVAVTRDPKGRAAKSVCIAVIDTGSGIAPPDLPHVFDRFYKSPDSRGSGLGLSIARNLVTLHGGQMAAESQPGRGATFRFTLPLR